MTLGWGILGLSLVAGIGLIGCTGATGPAGPMGPAGTNGSNAPTPVYLYSQNFDGVGYSPASQFISTATGGPAITLAVSGSYFVSAPDCLKVSTTSGPGLNAGLFTASGVVPYVSGDCYVDAYMDLTSLGSLTETELCFIVGGVVKSDMGYSSTNGVYSYNNGTIVPLLTTLAMGYFHHFLLTYHAASGLTDLTLDGLILGQGLNAFRPAVSGSPSTSVALVFPLSTNPGDVVFLDNLTVYHY